MNALAKLPQRSVGQGRVTAAARVRPFDGTVYTLRVDPAFGRMPSIAEIVAAIPDLPRGFSEICEARINGDLIRRGCWHLVHPRQIHGMDTAVTFTVPLGGGGSGGGSKSTIAMVATIAVLLAAAAVSGGALGIGAFVGAAIGTTAVVGASVAGAAIGIGGNLARDALGERE
jgi:hypothetical protein